MGCAPSKSDDDCPAVSRSRLIDIRLRRDAEHSRNVVKLLLLGAEESVKSTITKQIKILHQGGFSEQERMSFKAVVYTNTVQSMLTIVKAMESLNIDYGDPEIEVDVEEVRAVSQTMEEIDITTHVGDALKRLWQDSGVQACVSRSREYQLNNSAFYFLDALDRLCSSDYIPTEQDVLHTVNKTTGIMETTFQYKNLKFTLVDVGGQRGERRKWIHCFQDVTAIFFCAAMSTYDQVLAEDEETNGMIKSLKLFQSICNNPFFAKTPIILFLLNDLFEEKIKWSPLTVCFKNYTGGNTYEEAFTFIRSQFEAADKNNSMREIYTHITSAIDDDCIRHVFAIVSDIIIKKIVDELYDRSSFGRHNAVDRILHFVENCVGH